MNVLGLAPLIPCYLNGNTSNTIQCKYRGAILAEATADSRHDSGNGSQLFEISIWMWRYGRNYPREVSVADAVGRRRPCESSVAAASSGIQSAHSTGPQGAAALESRRGQGHRRSLNNMQDCIGLYPTLIPTTSLGLPDIDHGPSPAGRPTHRLY